MTRRFRRDRAILQRRLQDRAALQLAHPFPLSSLQAAIRIEGEAARGPKVPPALPEPFHASPHRPLLAQLRERGHVCGSGRSRLVGYDASGQPLSIELSEYGFIGVGGQPRVGVMRSTAEFLLPNAALARQAARNAKGHALYWGTLAPAVISIPHLGTEDLVYAAHDEKCDCDVSLCDYPNN